ncbi:MAG: DUF547 domain-containing protein [Tateyamaria sp.]|uniref:DUF547 domain-containing protein n=1 Tax=Tateyamaria sp. TaxID=1929288 RepID=UPI00328EB5D6
MLRLFAAFLLPLALTACASVERIALPKVAPIAGANWAAAADRQRITVNYSAYDTFLQRYRTVDDSGIARLRYKAVSPKDRASLNSFVDQLEATDPQALTRDQQLAFWINLYNAQTIALILDHYPVASIRDISDGPLRLGPWNRPDVQVRGQALSLNDIEHRIVRAHFKEPRVHYALNCAALGCPNLKAEAWRPQSLDADFEAAQTAYLAHPRGVSVDANGRVTASKIFIWFREDFGTTNQDVLAQLVAHTPPEKSAALARRGRIDKYAYDWGLNEAR